jgi:FKBP-type peptidyl-prolyl cis-trans isomerase 2
MPGLERAVEGLAVGGNVVFDMSPADAFGELNPKLIKQMPLEALRLKLRSEQFKQYWFGNDAPEGLAVGMTVCLQGPILVGGQTVRVVAVRSRLETLTHV